MNNPMTPFQEELLHTIRTIPDFPEPGVQFKDITPVLSNPDLMRRTLNVLVAPYAEERITKVLGIESRGFIFGGMLAERLGAGFVLVRKVGKLPAETIREDYSLEYGTGAIEMHRDALRPEDHVLIHDDVLATGGTALAAARLVRQAGAHIVGFSFLIELDALEGRKKIESFGPVHALIHY